ncbi:MAG: acyl-CoA thioesterase [Fuerstiella sp.]|nr:acyl-CoA thioesterase [Fuerstiella sp.]MDG2126416.1 acyl-CoA thioesterase [Fuerstiella sp.]
MPVKNDLPSAVASALADYRTITSLPVQWGDMDAFGHVNNVVYIRWFESARIDLLASWPSEVTMDGKGIGPILASVKCDYKRQLHFPETVHIGSKAGRMGRSSVDIEHAVFSEQQGRIAATGTSVMVVFDYAANHPVRIPENLRRQMDGNSG